jgi:hypothetical protein
MPAFDLWVLLMPGVWEFIRMVGDLTTDSHPIVFGKLLAIKYVTKKDSHGVN